MAFTDSTAAKASSLDVYETGKATAAPDDTLVRRTEVHTFVDNLIDNVFDRPIFYLAGMGQSNLKGQDTTSNNFPLTARPGEIQLWKNDNTWTTWNPATQADDFWTPIFGGGLVNNTYGPVWVLANLLADQGYLVRVFIESEGGRPISNWLTTGGSQYWDRFKDTQLANAAPGKLDCIYWHQGEADKNRSNADYLTDLNQLYTQIQGLTEWSGSSVFVVSELAEPGEGGSTGRSTSWQNLALRQFAEANRGARLAENAFCTTISGDPVHLSSVGAVQAGHEAYAKVTESSENNKVYDYSKLIFSMFSPVIYLDSRHMVTSLDADADLVTWTDKFNNITGTPDYQTPGIHNDRFDRRNFSLRTNTFNNISGRITFTLSTAIAQPLTILCRSYIFGSINPTQSARMSDSDTNRVLFDKRSNGAANPDSLRIYAGSDFGGTAAVTSDQWNTLGAVANGVSSKTYINGVYDTTGDAGTDSLGPTLHIGNQRGSTSTNFTAYEMQRYMIVDRELNAAEIKFVHDAWEAEANNTDLFEFKDE